MGNQLAFPLARPVNPTAYAPPIKKEYQTGSARFETLSPGRSVVVGARSDGSMFMDVPRQVYPNGDGKRITLPGITTKNSSPEITKALQRLTSNPNLTPYVYNADKKAIYNTGGPNRSEKPAFENTDDTKRKIFAHAGKREDKYGMPGSPEKIVGMKGTYPESDRENGWTALTASADMGAGLKVDYRLGKDGRGYLHHDHEGKRVDKFGKEDKIVVNIRHGRPEDVQQIASPFTNVLSKFNRVDYPNSAFIKALNTDHVVCAVSYVINSFLHAY